MVKLDWVNEKKKEICKTVYNTIYSLNNNRMCYIYSKTAEQFRGVFRTLSNIYDTAFCRE